MIELVYLGLYLVAVVLFIASDGWIEWAPEKEFIGTIDVSSYTFVLYIGSLLWPITIWFILGSHLNKVVKKAKVSHDLKKEREEKLRIIELKKLEAIEAELDLELEKRNKENFFDAKTKKRIVEQQSLDHIKKYIPSQEITEELSAIKQAAKSN